MRPRLLSIAFLGYADPMKRLYWQCAGIVFVVTALFTVAVLYGTRQYAAKCERVERVVKELGPTVMRDHCARAYMAGQLCVEGCTLYVGDGVNAIPVPERDLDVSDKS